MRASWKRNTSWGSALTLLLVIVVLVAIGVLAVWGPESIRLKSNVTLGLDLSGGVNMVLQAKGPVDDATMDAAVEVLERRVNPLAVGEPVIQREGDDRIIIQIAGLDDPDAAREMVGRTAKLQFVDEAGNVVLEGSDVGKAGIATQNGVNYVVTLELKGEGPDKFAKATAANQGKRIYIMLDEEVISAPTVRETITGGQAQITGDFTAEEAQQLAQLINGGALPVELEVIENRLVSATLGEESLTQSLYAALVGMAAVILFLLILYRVPGLMAAIALTLYGYLTIGFLVAVNATFSLPSIAGLLLSVGMAVDANVIIFERIKEELRNGKGLRSGIQAGFSRAYAAVIDSNLTTVIAGVILWFFGTGPVKGFALTMIVGVLLSMFTAITVTRWLINLCVSTGWFGKNLFGIKEVAQ